jgi:hypothetical protein
VLYEKQKIVYRDAIRTDKITCRDLPGQPRIIRSLTDAPDILCAVFFEAYFALLLTTAILSLLGLTVKQKSAQSRLRL